MRPGWLAIGSALTLVACADGADRASNDTKPGDIAELLAADLRNPELSNALSARIEAIRAKGGSVPQALLDAGFRRTEAEPGCEAFAYDGEERRRLGIDRTLRVRWKKCADARPDSEMTVTFGDF